MAHFTFRLVGRTACRPIRMVRALRPLRLLWAYPGDSNPGALSPSGGGSLGVWVI
jgi:hypothetical protein